MWQSLVPRGAIVFGLLTIALGGWALWHVRAPPDTADVAGMLALFSAVLFDVAGLFVLEKPAVVPDGVAFSLARVTAVCTASLGVLYIVLGVYRESTEQWRLSRYARRAARGRRKLIVICGLGRVGRQIVSDLAGSQAAVVIIELNAGHPHLQEARDQGAVVVVGDARSDATLRRARVTAAAQLFVVCGDDSINLDVAGRLARHMSTARGRFGGLDCYVNVVSPALAYAAHENPAFGAPRGKLRFHFFSVVDNAARLLVREQLATLHAPHAEEVGHLVLFGFGAMGQAVALHAARLAHVENERRLRMTIIDDWADPTVQRSRTRFLERYPAFCPDPATFDLARHIRSADPQRDAWQNRAGRPADPKWRSDDASNGGSGVAVEYVVNAEFLELRTDPDAPALLDELALRLSAELRPAVRGAVIVCFDDDRRNLEAALRVSAGLGRERVDVPTFVYLPDDAGLAALLRGGSSAGLAGAVREFGACEVSAGYDQLVQPEIIALAESFRHAYAAARPETGSALDMSYWSSNLEAAHHVDIKLAALNRLRARHHDGVATPAGAHANGSTFSPDERELLARMEHNRYVAERLLAGWRYGPRDDATKRRDSLVPWEDLSEDERVKDREQVDALAAWLTGSGTARAPTAVPQHPAAATTRSRKST